MSYYAGVAFNFIKVLITGYIAYKYPNNQTHTHRFHRALTDSIIHIDSHSQQTQQQSSTSTQPLLLDDSKDEEYLEEDPEELRCVICMVNKRKTIILPCQHSHVCIKCVKRLDKCPVCRENIVSKISYIN